MTVGSLLGSLRRQPVIAVAAIVAAVLLILAVAYPLLTHVDPNGSQLRLRLQPPSWLGGEGLLGTDQLGRDLWTRILFGLRTSFLVSIGACVVGAVVGTAVGLAAGYFGGKLDAVLMRITDIQLSFPALLLAMLVVGLLGKGIWLLVLILGLSTWMIFARVIRSAVLQIRSTELVVSSTSIGATRTRIVLRHVLPNVLGPLAALVALEFARIMLAEASLSFLGFGVEPPGISLGAILAGGRDYLQSQWWIATFAGLFLALAVLSTNLVGSWLQRVVDPTRVTT
ncbi:peptide ABC transporter permease [Pseudonocardia sulfidoxydans NBRC 16205]|uniref:Peptide ABC transporter permease n=1 Tax=Pseudonocardia sulfidoxydans NBRC 16205 TaxID=1223511 RepID=A0A511DNK2_9PSEU|nr:ABC transporter permease [Pseudonocardia sulfidoxydans]GEL26389.1 peptide ABC transporter permease [Pseudonocardia sulfidoxydans NBRC 16205]